MINNLGYCLVCFFSYYSMIFKFSIHIIFCNNENLIVFFILKFETFSFKFFIKMINILWISHCFFLINFFSFLIAFPVHVMLMVIGLIHLWNHYQWRHFSQCSLGQSSFYGWFMSSVIRWMLCFGVCFSFFHHCSFNIAGEEGWILPFPEISHWAKKKFSLPPTVRLYFLILVPQPLLRKLIL